MEQEGLFNYLLSINSNCLLGEFISNHSIPDDCAMLIFDNGLNEFSYKFKQIDSKFEVLTITDSNSFSFLTPEIARITLKNHGKYFLNYGMCIEFDTQVASYLANLILGKKLENDIFYSIKNFIDLFKLSTYDFSCFPYCFENSIKIKENERDMLNTLVCYEYFRNETENDLKYPISIENMPKKYIESAKADLFVYSQMVTDEQSKYLYDVYKAIYCLLLKTVIIEFSDHNSLKNQLSSLFYFIDYQLGVFLEREIAVCYGYLKKIYDIRNTFFKKIHINSNNVLYNLKGMAWDLTHIRMIEYLISVDYCMEQTLYFHYLVSFDKGLRAVMKYYPIDRIIFYKTTPYIKFKYPLYDFISEIDIKGEWSKNVEFRRALFKNVNLNALIETLEKELVDLQKSVYVK